MTWDVDDIIEAVKVDEPLQIGLLALLADIMVGWVWVVV
jgi:hypothetical protein